MAKTKKKISRKLIRKRLLQFSAVCVVAIALVLFYIGFTFVSGIISDTDNFDVNRLLSSEATEIFDDGGNLLQVMGNSDAGTRDNVTYDDLPQVLIDAVVAAEDSRFFEHNGFDLPRIVKATIGNMINGGITSGGSTITQQLIKKSYWTYEEEDTNIWQRKISEIYLAIQADEVLEKETILELYLNKIYFGRGTKTIGVQAASKYYFNKDVSELTLPEAALLAGTLNSPDLYDPFYNLEGATNRRNVILELMLTHGYITEQEYNAAVAIKVENTLVKVNSISSDYNPEDSYIDTMLTELYKYIESGQYPELIGLDPLTTAMEIHTFMNADMQDYATQIASGEAFNYGDDNLEVGASVQDTTTGKVIAVIGGRNYAGVTTPEREAVNMGLINYATERHQPGSSLKPIISYAAAFEYLNWSTGQSVSNEAITLPGGHVVNNWDFSSGGDIQLQFALQQSYNLPAIHTYNLVAEKIGVPSYISFVEGFGFDLTNENFNSTYSIGSWDQGINPIEGAGAYAALSNSGQYIQPHTINYIVLKDTGTIIDIHNSITPTQAVSASTAYMIQSVLATFAKTQYYGTNINYNLAAKSGTSDWGDEGANFVVPIPNGANKDSWFQCYTEDYAVSVWLGYPGELAYNYGYYLSAYQANYLSSNIGAQLLSKAQGGVTKNSYTKPDDITQTTMIKGLSNPYVKPTSDTPSANVITAWFKNSNLPVDVTLSSQLNALTDFNATFENNVIAVKFKEYENDDATAIKIYGDAIYGVEIRDASTGAVLHTQTSTTASFNINYTPSSSFVVVGFYTRSGSSSIRSAERSVTITVAPKTASYTVNYYTDNVLTKTEVLTGTIGEIAEVNADKYLTTGYESKISSETTKITSDGKAVINVYYTKKVIDDSSSNNSSNSSGSNNSSNSSGSNNSNGSSNSNTSTN